jgi:hypothetical protein
VVSTSVAPILRAIIHIGADKAGSSPIQSWLVKNREVLKENGVYYPFSEDAPEWSAKRGLTSGTGRILLSDLTSLNSAIVNAERSRCHSIVFSSESFMRNLNSPMALERIDLLRNKYGLDVEIFGLVRDPLEYLQSVYNQNVKTGMYSDTFSNFLIKSYLHPERMPTLTMLPNLITKMREVGVPSHLKAFSTVKQNLIGEFSQWCLSVQLNSNFEDQESVNLNLSYTDLEIMRGINSVAPRLGIFLGFEFAAINPNLFSLRDREQKYYLSREGQEALRVIVMRFRNELESLDLEFLSLDYSLENVYLVTHELEVNFNSRALFEFGRGLGKSMEFGFLNWGFKRNWEF